MTTKEQKAMEACKELLKVRPQYFNGDTTEKKSLILAIQLAQEATSRDVSPMAVMAMKNLFAMPLNLIKVNGEQSVIAEVIEQHTHCGELRECLRLLWNNTFNVVACSKVVDDRIRAVLKATE